MSSTSELSSNVVNIPAKYYYLFCLIVAVIIGFISTITPVSTNVLGAEVFLTVISLFLFGSIKYRIDKNAITYGALMIIVVTFLPLWWPHSDLRQEMAAHGGAALWEAIHHTVFTIHGLEKLIHGDTMLFILGLTFFVSVISQTRLLETVSMSILKIFKGKVLSTVLLIGAIVSVASGILDGVSMIGLTIRVFIIILAMANYKTETIKFAVMISVVITTVCGMWLAYGEPPNLIMKSNLGLNDAFFLKYSMPMAIAAFFVVVAFLTSRLSGTSVDLDGLDALELSVADIKFMQAFNTGEVLEMEDVLHLHAERLGDKAEQVYKLCEKEHHPISAMFACGVEEKNIKEYIKEFIGEKFVAPVYAYYVERTKKSDGTASAEEHKLGEAIKVLFEETNKSKKKSQLFGKIAFFPFVGLLIIHANNHDVPLFISSFVGFFVALIGIFSFADMRKLAIKDAMHEYTEYLFLFPLFLSISMLTAVDFFAQMRVAIEYGVETIGHAHVAAIQFLGTGILSAILDNNVVADFASRAIDGMSGMYLFAAAQIAGYATGGSLTHIGSAQSVVAYAYICRYVDPHFTPAAWIRSMWKIVLSITVLLLIMIYGRAFLFGI